MRKISQGVPTKELRDPVEDVGLSHSRTAVVGLVLLEGGKMVPDRMPWRKVERSDREETRPPPL